MEKKKVERTTSIYGLKMTIEEKEELLDKIYSDKENRTGTKIRDIEYDIDVLLELLAYKENIKNLYNSCANKQECLKYLSEIVPNNQFNSE